MGVTEELVRSGYDALTRGDLDALTGLLHPDIEWSVIGRNPLAGEYHGKREVLGFFGLLDRVTDGTFRVELEDVVADGHRAVVMTRSTARVVGRRLDDRGVAILEVQDGKLVRARLFSSDPYRTDELLTQAARLAGVAT